jgi:hypothetical protein
MTGPGPDSEHPAADWAADRQRLADLIGLLLARRWLRERRRRPPVDDVLDHHPAPAGPLRPDPRSR